MRYEYGLAMSPIANGACRICRQVKGGTLREIPVGLTPVGESIPGGVVIRPSEGPVPFICAECEEKQRNGEIAMVPGQVIEVEVDNAWNRGLFVRPGEPAEAELVTDPRVESGEYRRDVAFVRLAGADGDQPVPYGRIRVPL